MNNAFERLKAIIERETGISEVSPETKVTSLVKDSLEFLSLVSEVQNEFGVEIPNKQFAQIEVVQDLLNLLVTI